MYVHDFVFPLLRERERERERERQRAATLVHALCFDAFVDVFVNEEFKMILKLFNPDFEKFDFRAMTFR